MEYASAYTALYQYVLKDILFFAIAIFICLTISSLSLKLLKTALRKATPSLFLILHKHLYKSVFLWFTLLFLQIAGSLYLSENEVFSFLGKAIYICTICSFSWMLVGFTNVLEDLVYEKYSISKANNKYERKIVTQWQFVRRLIVLIIVVVTLSVILMSFEEVKKLGAGILTSAGVIGILIGVAAQKSIANILAGFQIAFTQPIKVDDVVIVENEWGNIEEINLTYVVVKLWDLRRLVVPLSYFLEKPFQNWTRESADILGTVFLYVDYSVPIETLRDELQKMAAASPLWDGRIAIIQVTNMLQTCIELRLLVSAHNSPDAFDLRCELREKMVKFLQTQYPQSLPKYRVDGPTGIL